MPSLVRSGPSLVRSVPSVARTSFFCPPFFLPYFIFNPTFLPALLKSWSSGKFYYLSESRKPKAESQKPRADSQEPIAKNRFNMRCVWFFIRFCSPSYVLPVQSSPPGSQARARLSPGGGSYSNAPLWGPIWVSYFLYLTLSELFWFQKHHR